MGFSSYEEPRRRKFLALSLKHAFDHCRSCGRRISSPKMQENSGSEFNDEQEDVASEIRSRALEARAKRKTSFKTEGYRWVLTPARGELFMIPRPEETNEQFDYNHEGAEEFYSVSSTLSQCSFATTAEQYLSVKTNFSELHELDYDYTALDLGRFAVREFWWGLDDRELQRRSIIGEVVCQCEGWPFGLCRKALLLPPLPKSPSGSWSWCKR